MFEKLKDWLHWQMHAVIGIDSSSDEEREWVKSLSRNPLVFKLEPFEGWSKWESGKPVSESILITSPIAYHFSRKYASKFVKPFSKNT